MGLYRCSDEHEKKSYNSYEDSYASAPEVRQKSDKKDEEDYSCEKDSCDSESAKALKKILSLIDELNNHDLKILEDIIERLLCSRSHEKVY